MFAVHGPAAVAVAASAAPCRAAACRAGSACRAGHACRAASAPRQRQPLPQHRLRARRRVPSRGRVARTTRRSARAHVCPRCVKGYCDECTQKVQGGAICAACDGLCVPTSQYGQKQETASQRDRSMAEDLGVIAGYPFRDPLGLRAARAVHVVLRLFRRVPRPGRADAVHVPRPHPRVERRPQELHAGRHRPRRAHGNRRASPWPPSSSAPAR